MSNYIIDKEELEEDDEMKEAPYGRDSYGMPYSYEDVLSAHGDQLYHEMREEG